MPALPMPPMPDSLTGNEAELWEYHGKRLEFLNHEVVAAESAVARRGARMRNRSGGYSTSPESRKLNRLTGEQSKTARRLEALMDRAATRPEPETELTQAQMVAEFAATLALGRDCPDDVVDQVIALTRLAAGDPPDADAADQVAAILAKYPAAADMAAVVLPDIDA